MKWAAAGALLISLAASASGMSQDGGREGKSKDRLLYTAEPQSVAAGKQSLLELHFKVQDGFHINSHTPKSAYLLSTRLELDLASGVTAAPLEYPPGTAYSFSFEPHEKLDVYSGRFTLKLPVVATAGEHKLTGSLRYQACDRAACYPPKSLPVAVLFTAK